MRLQNLVVALAVSLVVPWAIACSDDDDPGQTKPDAGDDSSSDAIVEQEDAAPDVDKDTSDEDSSEVQQTCAECFQENCAEQYQDCLDDTKCGPILDCIIQNNCLSGAVVECAQACFEEYGVTELQDDPVYEVAQPMVLCGQTNCSDICDLSGTE